MSATVAAHLARHPDATHADIVTALSAGSVDLGDAGRDPIFGFGVVKAGLCHDDYTVSGDEAARPSR